MMGLHSKKIFNRFKLTKEAHSIREQLSFRMQNKIIIQTKGKDFHLKNRSVMKFKMSSRN